MIVNYFKGKICTIITNPINIANLGKAEMVNIFTGTVDCVDEDGILMCNFQGLKSYFYNTSIVCILEEKITNKTELPIKSEKTPITMDVLSNLVKKD